MTVARVSSKLVVYAAAGDAETAVRQIASVIGSARCCGARGFVPQHPARYQHFVIGGALTEPENADRVDEFVRANAGWLKKKQVALFGLGGSTETGAAALARIKTALGGVMAAELVPGGPNGLDAAALAAAALRLRAAFREQRPRMADDEVKRRLEDILTSEVYLTLCTGSGAQVRGTTIGYSYRDGHVYAFCEGAEKFANIMLDPRVALAFYRIPQKDGFQASGSATVVYPGTEAYRELCARLGRDHERLSSLPFALNGLVIRLHKAEYYSAAMREEGYDSKQVYYF